MKRTFFRRIGLVLLLIGVLSMNGFSCTLFKSAEAEKKTREQVVLNFWRVFDDAGSLDELIKAYRSAHPNVVINVKKFRAEEYEKELLNALAEDRGPDLFSLHNTWIDGYIPKIEPMPAKLRVGYQVMKGTIKKVAVSEIRETRGLTPREMKDLFVDTVVEDVVRSEKTGYKIYGLPFSLDTLALFYNTEMFDSAGVAAAPTQWGDSFAEIIGKLTIIDEETDTILQSGAAFGTAKNIQRSADILSALMMQRRTAMTSRGSVAFNVMPPDSREPVVPGLLSLSYYTDFASPTKSVYTWNEGMPDSMEAFIQERVAMVFGYSYHASLLRSKAPQLKFRVAPLPQASAAQPVTVANYWVEAVSKKSKNADMAWDFLLFAAARGEKVKDAKGKELFRYNIEQYLSSTGKPTALRALIEKQKTSEELYPFVSQLLVAKNWYHGRNPASMEAAFSTMITNALTVKGGDEQSKLKELLDKAQAVVQEGY